MRVMHRIVRTLLIFVLLAAAGFAQVRYYAETKRRAEAGDVHAQFNLYLAYSEGKGAPQDDVEAFKWCQMAENQGLSPRTQETYKKAEAGDVKSQILIAKECDYRKNNAEAAKWWRRAAEQGNDEAQNNLGIMYYRGEGVPEDCVEAMYWFRKVVAQGGRSATSAAGTVQLMYSRGELGGKPKNSREKVEFLRKAAEQGDAIAQYYLGGMYQSGAGAPKDLVQAHVWYNIAGANGYEDAKRVLAIVDMEMTSEQKAEAMKLARELFAKLPNG